MPLVRRRWFNCVCFLLKEESTVAEGACEVFSGEEI